MNGGAEKPAALYENRRLICPECKASCRYGKAEKPKDATNYGRCYYTCPSSYHKFFKWADQVEFHELIQVPHCGGCGAGLCRVKEEATGPNKGRILFTCTVKEGEGSCGYRVWQDELEMSEAGERMNLLQCKKTSATLTDVDKENNERDEGTGPVSPLMEPSDDVICREVISRKMVRYKSVEGKSRTTTRRPSKRSRYGDIIAADFPISASFLTVWPDGPDLNFMSSTDCWMVDAFCQNLSSELYGWWGRLVFRPMRCLMAHELKPSTPSVSYPREFTFVVQGIIVNHSITESRNSKGDERYIDLSFDVEQHGSPIDTSYVLHEDILETSCDASTSTRSLLGAESYDKPTTQATMSESISNAFHRAAELIQDELRARLETMDAKDHEAMSQEAEKTFAALDHLRSDYKDFKKHVKELIHSASQLVETNQAMLTDDSLQKLIKICSSERKRLDKINCVHAEAVEAKINNKKCIQHLQEQISGTKDWLFQIEAEVSCCEAEMRSLELKLEEISINKEVLEGKYLIASKEVEESQGLLQQKETKQNAAKAKFNRAKASLRG